MSQSLVQLQRGLERQGVDGDALAVRDDLLVLDARQAPTLEVESLTSALEHMTKLATNFEGEWPSAVVAEGNRVAFKQALSEAGRDALLWAALRAAKPSTAPLRLDVSLETLSTRLDANPLALVRRAHARLAQVSVTDPDLAQPTPNETAARGVAGECPSGHNDADGALAANLVLLEQAAHAPRARPYVLAVENLADSALRLIERATPPELWTNMKQLRVARRVLSATLQAVDIAAPVPY